MNTLTSAAVDPFRRPRHGFALVIVLLVLSLLAIIAVGYLSSMSSERATASAFGNKTRAEQAAQAGVDTAMGLLRDNFKAFPDSVTAWDTAQSTNADGSAPNEGTTLYLRAVPLANSPDTPDPNPGVSTSGYSTIANYSGGNNPSNGGAGAADTRQIFALPLVSGATIKSLANKGISVPTLAGKTASAPSNFINLNSRRQINDAQGWIGSPPGYVNPANSSGVMLPKPVSVPWIEITQKDNPASPSPSPSPAPVIARYAFWVEDESFRANINYADQGQDLANLRTFRRDNNANYVLNAADNNLLGVLGFFSDTAATVDRTNLITARNAFPGLLFPEPRAFTHATGLSTDTVNALRYLTTTQSAALNLSRHGTQRLNLNAVMSQSPLPTDPGAGTIMQSQFDKIVQTIQFHAPNFGQRFYRNTASVLPADLNAFNPYTSTPTYPKIYLAKVAANIRDYIDTDSFPTCVLPADVLNPNGKVQTPAVYITPIGDVSPGPAWALGKDAIPFMQECAARYRCTYSGTAPSQVYTLYTDYYIEVWNMSNKDVLLSDLGPKPFIRIGNPTKWWGCRTDNFNLQIFLPAVGTASPSDTRPPLTVPPQPTNRDFDIDLTGPNFLASKVIFPAGVCTVITTDPDNADIITDSEAKNHVVLCQFKKPGTRVYTGTMPVATTSPLTYCNDINMEFDNTTSSDFETDTVIGSDYGHIDSLSGALTLSWGGRICFPYTGSGTVPKIFGGYLRGNWTNTTTAASEGKQASALGDPRTLNEQLYYDPSSSSSNDKTRFTNYAVGNAAGVFPTLGLPNTQSVHPNRPENPWPDYPPLFTGNVLSAALAPAVIANAPLTSIGQLGDVFDPARINSSGITSSRGGGRSFKIGQHDDRWDGDEASASRGWTSWRLADFFCVADSASQPGLIDPDGMRQAGLFNINGVTRDKGDALRAALNGFRFQPASAPAGVSGDPTLADPTDTSKPSKLQIDNLVNQIISRLKASSVVNGAPNYGVSQTGAGPFWERGEISELPLFGRSPDTTPANTYPTMDLVGSVDMSSAVFDRGREELVRRLIEMMTTRGSVFTVYAVGQALLPNPADPTARRVMGTQQLKVTFRLVPKNATDPTTGSASDFHPGTDSTTGKSTDGASSLNLNDSAQLNTRFAKPDHYEVQTIYSSSDNS